MKDTAQREAFTCYLMHKVAVRSGDEDLAAECLEAVATSKSAKEYLYACVVDAQQSAEKRCAIAALKKLVQCHDPKSAGPVHVPALLRCIIRLLWTSLDEIKEGEDGAEARVEDLCQMFDSGTFRCFSGMAIVNPA